MKHTALTRDRGATVSLLIVRSVALLRPDVMSLFIGGVPFPTGPAFPAN